MWSATLFDRVVPGLGRNEDGDDGDERHRNEVRGERAASVREQRRGDKRRKPARDNRRELRSQRRAAVSYARAEQFREERGLRSVHRRMREHERHDEREPHRGRRSRVEQPEERIREERRNTGTEQVDRPPPNPIIGPLIGYATVNLTCP